MVRRSRLITLLLLLAFAAAQAAERPKDARASNAKTFVASGAQPALVNRIVAGPGPSLVSSSGYLLFPLGVTDPFFPTGDAALDAELQTLIADIRERERRLLQNAEYRDLVRARYRLTLARSHPNLREYLQLSKEQADALLDLLAEQQIREQVENESVEAMLQDGTPAQVMLAQLNERQNAKEAELLTLLGDAKFQEWKEYEQSALARFQAERFSQLLPPEAALRPDQLRSLVATIAREQRRQMEETLETIRPGQPIDQEFVDHVRARERERLAALNDRIVAGAASFLSPEQLQRLRAMLNGDFEAFGRAIAIGQGMFERR